MDKAISAYLLKLRRSHPFLATLSLFARYEFKSDVDKFCTDDRTIYIDPEYFKPLGQEEKTGLLLHVTLHTALQHGLRVSIRNPTIWNIAADIVVNNIILETGIFKPPRDTAVDKQYMDWSVEQVYEQLMALPKKSKPIQQAMQNLQSNKSHADKDNHLTTEYPGSYLTAKKKDNKSLEKVLTRLYQGHSDLKATIQVAKTPEKSVHQIQKDKQYWQSALRKADTVRRMEEKKQGQLPANLLREIELLLSPNLDWRTLLWHFVARTPSDFGDFDRRFVYRGLYLDKLETESLNVLVAIDTSGSIADEELAEFIAELRGIQRAYQFIKVTLYYVDADIYGPYDFRDKDLPPSPRGGGGTDFAVFFEKILTPSKEEEFDIVVYFTDGYGTFPKRHPRLDTLWVISAGGEQSNKFPFGRVARLAS